MTEGTAREVPVVQADVELATRIAEVVEEDGGCWSPCSGCQESVDGYVSFRHYPYSAIFKCQPGGGCRECGGIGVLWQDGAFLASYGDPFFLTEDHRIAAEQSSPPVAGSFQSRVQPWMMTCFGEMIAGDREERNHRLLEEALELVQACGCTASEARQLVDYVYGRPIGEPAQEVGGVMVTLAALCLANRLDMHNAAEVELARIWTKVEAIRAKQAAKPKHSPLPQATPVTPPAETATGDALREAVLAAQRQTIEACARVADRMRGRYGPSVSVAIRALLPTAALPSSAKAVDAGEHQ